VLQDVIEIQQTTAAISTVSTAYEVGSDISLDMDGHVIHTDHLDLCDAPPEASFADQLLSALATMAMRSKRRQADLCAALCRSNLDTDPKRVTEALRQLERSGCIEHLVPLYDGGVLMSVTSRGIEKLNAGPRWNMLDGAGFLRG
jgi:hypothetical protein